MSYEEKILMEEKNAQTVRRYDEVVRMILEQNAYDYHLTVLQMAKMIVDGCMANRQPLPFGIE